MIITINQQKLRRAISALEKIVVRNLALPILQNIALNTDNGRLKLSSTNLEIGINYWIGAKVEEEGSVAIPARVLSDFVNNVSDEKLTITTKENNILINSDNYKTQILGFSVKEFPIIPKSKTEALISLPAQQWRKLFGAITDSAALSDARPELTGVRLGVVAGFLEVAATDGFRLAERRLEGDFISNFNGDGLIIPRATVQELMRILDGQETELVAMTVSENQIFFSTQESELVSRLIDGRYPDYKKLIPEKVVSRLVVNRTELEKGVRLASIFSSGVADIKLHIEKNELRIAAQNAARGEVNARIGGELKGEGFTSAVNYHYLLDGLKIIEGESIALEFTGDGGPLVLKGEKHSQALYLIMPLRS